MTNESLLPDNIHMPESMGTAIPKDRKICSGKGKFKGYGFG